VVIPSLHLGLFCSLPASPLPPSLNRSQFILVHNSPLSRLTAGLCIPPFLSQIFSGLHLVSSESLRKAAECRFGLISSTLPLSVALSPTSFLHPRRRSPTSNFLRMSNTFFLGVSPTSWTGLLLPLSCLFRYRPRRFSFPRCDQVFAIPPQIREYRIGAREIHAQSF